MDASFSTRPDYDRLLAQEASYFPQASRSAVERLLASSLPSEVQWVAAERPGYPEELYQLEEAPDVLIFEGDLSVLSRQVRLVVAGSRGASEHCQGVTESLCKTLAQHGVAVLSGMVSAVDMAAHHGSLAAQCQADTCTVRSCAIVAAPLGAPWPAGRHELGRALYEKGGLLVSLAPQLRGLAMDESERLERLDFRQRITAALATAVLVMHVRDGGFTVKLIHEALRLERPVLIWHEALGQTPSLEIAELLAAPPKDAAGRALVTVVKSLAEIEAAITAWQLVWWL